MIFEPIMKTYTENLEDWPEFLLIIGHVSLGIAQGKIKIVLEETVPCSIWPEGEHIVCQTPQFCPFVHPHAIHTGRCNIAQIEGIMWEFCVFIQVLVF